MFVIPTIPFKSYKTYLKRYLVFKLFYSDYDYKCYNSQTVYSVGFGSLYLRLVSASKHLDAHLELFSYLL